MRKVTDTTTLLVHLLAAAEAGRAVTIRYEKPVKDGVEISRRRIEIHAIEVDGKGALIIQCYDHRSRDRHTFRLDRVTHFTLHRAGGELARYTVPTTAKVVAWADEHDEDMVVGWRFWDFTFTLAA